MPSPQEIQTRLIQLVSTICLAKQEWESVLVSQVVLYLDDVQIEDILAGTKTDVSFGGGRPDDGFR
ncbi:MAG: hypothetical protein ABSH39_08920 [Candidatus Acidiferrum sp.]|jgi:hypothetical protein